MNAPRMREYLEFQILQVGCAPLIALVAYNLSTPANLQTSVVLGFASGFASEPILLAIRSIVDRITGTPPQETVNPRAALTPTADAVAPLAQEAAQAAAQTCNVSFGPAPAQGQALQFPAGADFTKEFTAALSQRLAPYGIGWTGQVTDLAGAKDWREVATKILAAASPRTNAAVSPS